MFDLCSSCPKALTPRSLRNWLLTLRTNGWKWGDGPTGWCHSDIGGYWRIYPELRSYQPWPLRLYYALLASLLVGHGRWLKSPLQLPQNGGEDCDSFLVLSCLNPCELISYIVANISLCSLIQSASPHSCFLKSILIVTMAHRMSSAKLYGSTNFANRESSIAA